MSEDVCAVADCFRPRRKKKDGTASSKWCAAHAMRVYRYGHPREDIPLRAPQKREIDIELKRLDSLARNRASAELKRRHRQEWEEIRRRIHNELKVERELLGEVTRTRTLLQHVEGPDGCCEKCGRQAPCEQMRKRARQRLAREQTPVPIEMEE